MSNFKYTAEIFDFGMDVCGNCTARWILRERGKAIALSGKRREQCGYNAQSDGPEYWLSKNRPGTYRGIKNRSVCGGHTVNLKKVR